MALALLHTRLAHAHLLLMTASRPVLHPLRLVVPPRLIQVLRRGVWHGLEVVGEVGRGRLLAKRGVRGTQGGADVVAAGTEGVGA